MHDIVTDAALLLVFEHELGSGLLECTHRPHTVDIGLSGLFHHSCELPFRLFEPSCASAAANSPPEDDLVDVPDPGPHDEAGYLFASHDFTPFDRPGRPLRDL